MNYAIDSHIHSVSDVEVFFAHLIHDCHLNFHPDDDFNSYVSIETGEPIFSREEIMLYNRLMDESFVVCDREGTDIYLIGLKELESELSQNV